MLKSLTKVLSAVLVFQIIKILKKATQ